MRLSILVLFLVGIAPVWNILQAEIPFSEKSEKDFNITGRPLITVKNPDGNTILQSSDAQNVHVNVTKEVRHAKNEAEAKKIADRVSIRLQQIDNRIEIEAIHPKFHLFSFGNGPYVVVTFQITAPKLSDITSSVSDGKMDVQGFDGALQLSIADGDLTAKDLAGKMKIHAADGNINVERCAGTMEFGIADGDLDVQECSGTIQASSADGSLILNQINGSVDARTSDGKMRVNGILNSLNAKASDGEIDVHVNNGSVMENDWSLKSSDGDIRLHLPDSFSADLDISTSDGHIETRRPIVIEGPISTSKILGKMGIGGHVLQIHTSDGDVQLLTDGQ